MHYGSASGDNLAKHEMKFHTLEDAIEHCYKMGMGVDVLMPRHRYHSRQAYIDNFSWKGEPTEQEVDDD